jgi:hypothetical protein
MSHAVPARQAAREAAARAASCGAGAGGGSRRKSGLLRLGLLSPAAREGLADVTNGAERSDASAAARCVSAVRLRAKYENGR